MKRRSPLLLFAVAGLAFLRLAFVRLASLLLTAGCGAKPVTDSGVKREEVDA